MLFVLNAFGIELLATFKVGIRHHAPKCDVAIADLSENGADLNMRCADDRGKSPVLDFLHGCKAIPTFFY